MQENEANISTTLPSDISALQSTAEQILEQQNLQYGPQFGERSITIDKENIHDFSKLEDTSLAFITVLKKVKDSDTTLDDQFLANHIIAGLYVKSSETNDWYSIHILGGANGSEEVTNQLYHQILQAKNIGLNPQIRDITEDIGLDPRLTRTYWAVKTEAPAPTQPPTHQRGRRKATTN